MTPYFDEDEYKNRVTEFERENNVRRFVFETPFTLSGKAHGALAEQHKRKTILTSNDYFIFLLHLLKIYEIKYIYLNIL